MEGSMGAFDTLICSGASRLTGYTTPVVHGRGGHGTLRRQGTVKPNDAWGRGSAKRS